MSGAILLTPRPSIDRYETLAEQLRSAGTSADSVAIHELAVRWLEDLASLQNLEITPAARLLPGR